MIILEEKDLKGNVLVRLEVKGVVEGPDAQKLPAWCRYVVALPDGVLLCRDPADAQAAQRHHGGEVCEVRR